MKIRGKAQKSLNIRILAFLIVCWIVPIAVFFTFTTVSYRKGIAEKAEKLMEDELKNATVFVSIRLGDAIAACQKVSYAKTLETAWKGYTNGEITRNDFMMQVYYELRNRFYMDEDYDMYAYYEYGNTYPSLFSSRAGIYRNAYESEIQPGLADMIDVDSSYPSVRVVDGKIYIVRNLYTTQDFKRYGTLVVGLNEDKVFRDIPAGSLANMVLCISDCKDVISFTDEGAEQEAGDLMESLLETYQAGTRRRLDKLQSKKYSAYLYQDQFDNYHMGVMLFATKSELYSSLYEFYAIVAVMMALFIPVFGYGVYFLRKHIQRPIDQMLEASKRMETGEIGVKVEGGKMPNTEFRYLQESFDSMSSQVKYLFDYVYDEKLARKDAQIQALQAQINPHFLNNTLEMMNWQARMSGDVVVSKMIESLGTVLDYRMNRANVKEIHLAEELQCIDAYFYIMSMRFGQRLQIEREIDGELLYIMVPPLILQPLVENAIVHGVERVKNGAIRLKVYHDEEKVYLEVHNTGKEMTAEQKERVQAILMGNTDMLPKYQGRHTSIGIQNVNRRIKLVYGEEYGLTIEQNETKETVSTITIPYREQNQVNLLKERNEVEKELKNMARLNK